MLEGMIFGLSAGLIPGPLMMTIIAMTLQHSRRQGLMVALMPLLAELPIIALVARGIASGTLPVRLLTIIGLLGGCFLLRMGYDLLTHKPHLPHASNSKNSVHFTKAFLVAFLNPNPYIFRLTAGAGIIQQVVSRGGSPRQVVIGFFIVFIGLNCLIVLFAHHIKKYIHSIRYRSVLQLLGLALLVMGGLMLRHAAGNLL